MQHPLVARLKEQWKQFLRATQKPRAYFESFWLIVRDNARIHQALIVLTFFILLNNAITVRAASDIPTIDTNATISDPYQIAETVRLIKDYIPGNETTDPDAIALALQQKVNGNFIVSNPLLATQSSQALDGEVEASPAPSSATTATNRTTDIKYTIQIGDTLSGIGTKYGLKVATLKVKNNITDVDSITPGQTITIPAQDLSDQAIQAATNRAVASQQLAQTPKTTTTAAHKGGYGFIVPIHYTVIARRLVDGHTGIDYDAPIGTPVYAAADGVVLIASSNGSWNGGYGNTALISHPYAPQNAFGTVTTRYGHMSSVIITAGQHVTQGQLIGYSGNTGRSTGPHLHFELRVNGVALDPGT